VAANSAQPMLADLSWTRFAENGAEHVRMRGAVSAMIGEAASQDVLSTEASGSRTAWASHV
jgi:hypothetical protein